MLHLEFERSLVLASATVVFVSAFPERKGFSTDSDLSLVWQWGISCRLLAEVVVF